MSSNRFSCLKPNDNNDNSSKYKPPGSRNNFRNRQQTNNRWKRDRSPEKKEQNSRFASMRTEERNSFSRPPRDNNYNNKSKFDRNKPKFDKGGFGRFRYNRGRRGPSIFDNVKKDNLGRPMLAGATTSGFDIGMALQKSKNKSKKKEKNVKKKEIVKEKPQLVPFKKDEKTEEQLKAEAEWNKQMILNMQYEWETDSEQEGEEELDDE